MTLIVAETKRQDVAVQGLYTPTFAVIAESTAIINVKIVIYRDWETDRKSTRLNSSHSAKSRMPSSA